MARKKPEWREYEEDKVAELGADHIGGPGNPDGVKLGDIFGITQRRIEVKDHEKPLGVPDVIEEIEKGRTDIVSKSGFTEDAKGYVRSLNWRNVPKVNLYDDDDQVV